AFSTAEEAGKYNGPNPVTKVKRRKVPERAPMFLEAWEADRLLQLHPIRDIWRRLFATALFTGLRKGELLGPKKADMHRERRQLVLEGISDRAGRARRPCCRLRMRRSRGRRFPRSADEQRGQPDRERRRREARTTCSGRCSRRDCCGSFPAGRRTAGSAPRTWSTRR